MYDEPKVNGKVKRIRCACCGMKNGIVYDADIGSAYVNVLLPDRTWTGPHWAGFGSDHPLFEILKEQPCKK